MSAEQLSQPAQPNPAQPRGFSVGPLRLSNEDRQRIQAERISQLNKFKANDFYRQVWEAMRSRGDAEMPHRGTVSYNLSDERKANAQAAWAWCSVAYKDILHVAYCQFASALSAKNSIKIIRRAIELTYVLDIGYAQPQPQMAFTVSNQWDMLGDVAFVPVLLDAVNYGIDTGSIFPAHKLMRQFTRINHIRAEQCVIELHAHLEKMKDTLNNSIVLFTCFNTAVYSNMTYIIA
jgi:hypothetical protein